ncbi:MAG TPA: multidrug transporter [Pseudolabrys sp.]|nr:multidrug transporter [Pseudolabrys sp.]
MLHVPPKQLHAAASEPLKVSRLRRRKLRKVLLTGFVLIVGGLIVADIIGGSTLLFSAEGIVTRERVAISAPYENTRIRELFVRPGDRVEAGQKIAAVESGAVSRSVADLSVEKARLRSRLAEIEAREAAVDELLPTAEAAVKQFKSYLDRVSGASAGGFVNDKTVTDIVSAHFTAAEKLASLQAEKKSLVKEREPYVAALADVSASYDSLQKSYGSGTLTTPVAGYVGTRIGAVGEVLSASAATVADIYAGESYVLAYVQDGYTLGVEPGQRVKVELRSRSTMGTVTQLLPVTAAMPPEFQMPARPRLRGQLMRVSIPDAADFPIGEQVKLSVCYFDTCESLMDTIRPSKVLQRVAKRVRDLLPGASGKSARAAQPAAL